MYVKCKFLDENKEPRGREYTYKGDEDLFEGEIVETPNGKHVIVTEIQVPELSVSVLGNGVSIKQVVRVPQVDDEPESEIDIIIEEPEQPEPLSAYEIPADLIVVEQLPIITEKFRMLGAEIDNKIAGALALRCNENTIKTVKTLRADLNKDFATLDGRRKEVKKAILSPYDQFEAVFNEFVGDKLKQADKVLKSRIDEIENAVKAEKETELKAFFTEYAISKGLIDNFVTFEKWNPVLSISVTLKAMKQECREWLDRIADDIELIKTQEHLEEILVEYRRSLNSSNAITTVANRHKEIEAQKAADAEREARRAAEREALAKVEQAVSEYIAPPMQIQPQEKQFTLAFKVTGTKAQLIELKNFIIEKGLKYQ